MREFLIAYPPTFNISNKCCMYAKKKPMKNFLNKHEADLNIFGVRKAEGGIRATAYKNCYTDNTNKTAEYRPIFWFSDDDKKLYEELYDIKHSDCYIKYGLKRTGCVGCPYGKNVMDELNATKIYEPNLHKACNKVFKDAYEYTQMYRDFVKEMKEKEKEKQSEEYIEGQLSIYDYV